MAFIEESDFMQVKIAQIPENIMLHYVFLLTFQRDKILFLGVGVNLSNVGVVFHFYYA